MMSEPLAFQPSKYDALTLSIDGAGRPRTPHTRTRSRPGLLESRRGEVGDDVGRDVRARVAHLVHELLLHRAHGDRAARAGMLRHDERAVGERFEHRIADARPVAHVAPVGEVAARALRAALDDVAGDDARGKPIPVVGRPAERVDHRRERDAGVRAAARDDDLRAGRQRFDERPRAVVRVRRRHAIADRRERCAVFHVVERRARRVQLAEPAHQVVACDRGDLERLVVQLADLEQRGAAGERVHAAGVRDDARARLGESRQRPLDLRDEIARVAGARITRTLLLHDRHRDLGEEVERDEVDGTELELALELREVVAPVAAGVGDANHFGHGARP
jgi:hypothetical protein